MPDLERGNIYKALLELKRAEAGYGKFVRKSTRIVYDSNRSLHKLIAASAQITSPDDAGRVTVGEVDGRLTFRIYGPSADFMLPETTEQRNTTLAIWSELASGEGIAVVPKKVDDTLDAWKT